MPFQCLTLTLDGITAGDYLAWVSDPEPAALGRELRSIDVRADPLGDTLEARLSWRAAPASAAAAATAAGFPLIPEVVSIASHGDELAGRRTRAARTGALTEPTLTRRAS